MSAERFNLSRRSFLKAAGLGGVVYALDRACSTPSPSTPEKSGTSLKDSLTKQQAESNFATIPSGKKVTIVTWTNTTGREDALPTPAAGSEGDVKPDDPLFKQRVAQRAALHTSILKKYDNDTLKKLTDPNSVTIAIIVDPNQ
jgi:hypothetical protein